MQWICRQSQFNSGVTKPNYASQAVGQRPPGVVTPNPAGLEGSTPTLALIYKQEDEMLVAVIYEESYVLYDQRYDRHNWDVVVQHSDENKEQFHLRTQRIVDALNSTYSYYDWDSFEYVPE